MHSPNARVRTHTHIHTHIHTYTYTHTHGEMQSKQHHGDIMVACSHLIAFGRCIDVCFTFQFSFSVLIVQTTNKQTKNQHTGNANHAAHGGHETTLRFYIGRLLCIDDHFISDHRRQTWTSSGPEQHFQCLSTSTKGLHYHSHYATTTTRKTEKLCIVRTEHRGSFSRFFGHTSEKFGDCITFQCQIWGSVADRDIHATRNITLRCLWYRVVIMVLMYTQVARSVRRCNNS